MKEENIELKEENENDQLSKQTKETKTKSQKLKNFLSMSLPKNVDFKASFINSRNKYLLILFITIISFSIKTIKNIFLYPIFLGGSKITVGILIERLKDDSIVKNVLNIAKELVFSKKINVYLFTGPIEQNEYYVHPLLKREVVYIDNVLNENNMRNYIEQKNIDVLIYNRANDKQIKFLYKLRTKLIIIFHDFYLDYVKNNKDLCGLNFLSKANLLINFYEDNLFLWNIKGLKNAVYFPQLPYDKLNDVITSEVNNQNILMIGNRNYDESRENFKFGFKIMKILIKVLHNARLQIVYYDKGYIEELRQLATEYQIEKNIQFINDVKNLHLYYQNASIFLLCTKTGDDDLEMSLSRAKAYKLPVVVVGKRYLVNGKKGSINIGYEDSLKDTLLEIANLLMRKSYRKKIGREGKYSLSSISRDYIINKWIKAIYYVNKENKEINKYIQKENKLINLKKYDSILREEFIYEHAPFGNFDELLNSMKVNKYCPNEEPSPLPPQPRLASPAPPAPKKKRRKKKKLNN